MEQDNQQMEVGPEEFRSWIEHKITKKIVSDIVGIREQLKEYMASGATVSKDRDVTTDRIVGRIEGLTEIFNMFTEVKEEAKEPVDYGH